MVGNFDFSISIGGRGSSCYGLVLVRSLLRIITDTRFVGGASCMCIAASVAELVSAYPVPQFAQRKLTIRLQGVYTSQSRYSKSKKLGLLIISTLPQRNMSLSWVGSLAG